MQAAQVIEQVQAAGGQLTLINGGLMGKNLTDSTRQLVKRHKAEIFQLLLDKTPTEPRLKTCPICRGRDFIHGESGGYFCTQCQPGARLGYPVLAGSTRS